MTQNDMPEETKPENLLEKAKLIADLASAWQNEELAKVMKKLPNGDKIFEIFSEAINREMGSIMTGKRADDPKLQNLPAQVDQLSSAMSGFHTLISGFLNSPLVQVLNLMNENLGARKFQMPNNPVPQAPQQQSVNYEDSRPSQRTASRAPGLASF